MRRLVTTFIALVCLLLPTLSATASAAFNPLGGACSAGGNAASSSACGTNGSDTISGKNGVLKKASAIIASVAGIAAVIIIIVAGLTYVSSGGNSQRIESARNAIINTVVGLAIIALAATIITYVAGRV